MFNLENKIGKFHQVYHIPSINKLSYHCSYYLIMGKYHVDYFRLVVFQQSPRRYTQFDYAERFSFFSIWSASSSLTYKKSNPIHWEVFLGIFIYTTTVIDNLPNGKQFTKNSYVLQHAFHSLLFSWFFLVYYDYVFLWDKRHTAFYLCQPWQFKVIDTQNHIHKHPH